MDDMGQGDAGAGAPGAPGLGDLLFGYDVGADGLAEGLSERYVRVRVCIRGRLPEPAQRRDLVTVNPVRASGDLLEAEPVAGRHAHRGLTATRPGVTMFG